MSLKTRALVAVLLVVGFYTLSLAVAALLLWIPYEMWTRLDHVPIKIAAACVITAFLILWSIIPRRDRFSAPGPRITESEQPGLFAEIEAVARKTGQAMPAEVYLIPEINAWVSQRGGIMGIGSRRVMGIGMPLMGLLTVSQFRAVLSHEFGHYHGGDTALGPWVYKTRLAIGRTIQTLAERQSIVVFLFNWYSNLFLRITLAISRAQEYAADRLAATLAGSKALMDGLKQIHKGAAAWPAYMQSEVVPVLSAGFSAPLAQGFNHFLGRVNAQAEAVLAKELEEGKADHFDTHPALAERIAAIQSIGSTAEEDGRCALELLDHVHNADCSLFLVTNGDALRAVTWDEVVKEVWVPQWRNEVERQADALGDMTARELAEQLGEDHLWKRCKDRQGMLPTDDERAQHAAATAAMALSLALMRDGWTLHALPGESYLEKDGKRLEPFSVTTKLRSREKSGDEWLKECEQAGITALRLNENPTAVAVTTSAQ